MLLMCPTIPTTTTPFHPNCYSVGTGTTLMKLWNFKQLLKLKLSFIYTHLWMALIILKIIIVRKHSGECGIYLIWINFYVD